jgi:uncharacterized repeat protein (TIGR01451 family)
MVILKLRIKSILVVMAAILFLLNPLKTWAGLPAPPDTILIVTTSDACDGAPGYEANMVTNLEAALAALGASAPTVKTIQTACNTTGEVGIQSALTGAGYTLSEFCEVFDLRFLSNPGVQSCTSSGDSSMITNTGANNDTQLYLAYLAQGGHLVLDADNAGFCNRDASVVSFVAAATGCNLGWNVGDTISNNAYTGPFTFNAPLQGAYNTLTAYEGDYPGYITAGNTCGATSLTTSGSDVFDMLWTGGQLTSGAGSLELNMDTNGLEEGLTGYQAYWQNVYAMNGTCYNFTMTKTVNPPTVCVGQSVTFTVCLKNTGTQNMTNPQITDVIPSCMSYVSSNPGGSAVGNNFSYTYVGTLATNQQACVNIVAQANNTNCP